MARLDRMQHCPSWAVNGNAHWNLPAGTEVWSAGFRKGQQSHAADHPEMRRWAERHKLPAWLCATMAYTLDRIPDGLAQHWQARAVATLQAQLEEDPATQLVELRTMAQLAAGGQRLDALAGLTIQATNDTFRDAADSMVKHGRRHAKDARTWLNDLGLAVPDSVADLGLAKRVIDHQWWRKELRQLIRRRRESLWLALAPTAVQWCSIDGDRERQSITETAEHWAENYEFVSNQGHHMSAPTPAQTDAKRRAELLAINAGIAQLSHGAMAWLVTITLPSRFHPTSGDQKNPKFDGSTPADGAAYFQTQWTRARAAMKRRGVGRHWTMGVQPHKDETLHAHLVCYETDAGMARLKDILLKYFRDIEREQGDHHRVRIDKLGSTEAGVRYVARAILYISRAAEHCRQRGQDDEDASQAAEESRRTAQWAATWRIRRFRTSHSAITAWRLARKPDVLDPEDPIKISAEAGDYATFIQAWTAADGRLVHWPATNRYDEETQRTVGLEVKAKAFLRQTRWRCLRKDDQTPNVGPRNRQLRLAPQLRLAAKRTVNPNCQGDNLFSLAWNSSIALPDDVADNAMETLPPRFARPPLGVKSASGEKTGALLCEYVQDSDVELFLSHDVIQLLEARMGTMEPPHVSHGATHAALSPRRTAACRTRARSATSQESPVPPKRIGH